MKKYSILLIIFFITSTSALIYSMEMNVNEIRQKIQARITEGENLNKPDNIGVIPLIFAAQQNDSDLAQKLISSKADVNVQDNHGSTPLSSAIRQGNVALAHFLIQHGARGDTQDSNGDTPRSLAQEYSLSYISELFEEQSKTTAKPKEDKGKEKEKAQATFTTFHLLNARNNNVEKQKKRLACFLEEKNKPKSSDSKQNIKQDDWYQLSIAVSKNNLEKITRLLDDENIDVNAQTPSDWTALALACDKLTIKIVKKLIHHKNIIVDLPLKNGVTPLMIIASKSPSKVSSDTDNNNQNSVKTQKKLFKIAKLLLEHGADIDAQDKEGTTALMKALLCENITLAKLLIKLGANTSIKDKHGFNALFYASGKGYLPIVERLIKKGALVDETTKKWNPLTSSLSKENYEIAKLLQQEACELIAKAEENIESQENQKIATNSPTLWKRIKNRIPILDPVTKKWYLEFSKNYLINHIEIIKSELRYLNESDFQEALELGEKLLSRSFEQTNEWYWINPEIYKKIYKDRKRIIEILTQMLFCKNRNIKQTPLYLAILLQATRVAQWLIEEGRDINSHEVLEDTPLITAILTKQFEIVQSLIIAGADVNKSSMKTTPLIASLQTKQIEIARLLIKAGADANKNEKNGFFPLQLAILDNQEEIVQLLIKAGADVNKIDEYGCSPLLNATIKKQPEIARLLIKAGANVDFNFHQVNGKGSPVTFLECIAIKAEFLETLKCILTNNPDLSKETKLKMRIWATRANNQQAIDALDCFIDDELGDFYRIPSPKQPRTLQSTANQRRNVVHIIEESTNKTTDLIELIDVLKKYNLLDEQSLEDIQEISDQIVHFNAETSPNEDLKKIRSIREAFKRNNYAVDAHYMKKEDQLFLSIEKEQSSTLNTFHTAEAQLQQIGNTLSTQTITSEEDFEKIRNAQSRVQSSLFEVQKTIGMIPTNPGGFPGRK